MPPAFQRRAVVRSNRINTDGKENQMTKPAAWLCDCAITMREIRAHINFGRELLGLRPMTMNKFYELRRNAAENFLAEHEFRRHGNKGLDRNPYLPDRLIGPSYIFKKRKANRLIRLGVAMRINKPGRQPGTRIVRRGGRSRLVAAAS